MESTDIHPEQPSFLKDLGTRLWIQGQELLPHAEKENAQESVCAYVWHVGVKAK